MSTPTTIARRQALAGYLRIHLGGASVGIRLAQHLAADPWMQGRLDFLPAELAEEIAFTQAWAQTLSGMPELWVRGVLAGTGVASALLRPVPLARGRTPRALALEAMRSLVLAKRAMWELGLALAPDPELREELEFYDAQAGKQVAVLQALHQDAAQDAFMTAGVLESPDAEAAGAADEESRTTTS